MKVNQLELTNYRCFEHQVLNFSEGFNVLIGDNGIGKTAILDTLAGLVSTRIPSENIAYLSSNIDDIRQCRQQREQNIISESQYPYQIYCAGSLKIDQITIPWETTVKKQDQSSDFSTDTAQTADFQLSISEKIKQIQQGKDAILPLFVYYAKGRIWQCEIREISTHKPASRFSGYEECLTPAGDLRKLLSWFKTMEIVSLQKGEKIRVLETVKNALINCIDNCQKIDYDFFLDQLMITFENGNILPFRMLSDGYRNLLGMVADLGYRASVLNPQLESDVLQETPGIVLIDEIELHLHPKWQRRIVEDLRRTFPKVQFIATTHSPVIIQSLRPGELINFDDYDGEDYHKIPE